MSRKIRAVFDLNVIFSGIGWRGAPYKCLEAVRDGLVIGFVAAPSLTRLRQLLIIKLGYSDQQARHEVDDLKSYLRVVEITGRTYAVEYGDSQATASNFSRKAMSNCVSPIRGLFGM